MPRYAKAAAALGPVLLLSACAPKAVRPKSILLCASQRCETVSDAPSRERLLLALNALMRRAKGGRVDLSSADPATGAAKKNGISFYVQGGPIPGVSTISSLDVRDVLYVDRQASNVKARLKTVATYVAVPLLCTESNAAFTVLEDRAELYFSNICNWAAVGTTATRFQWLIDRVDTEAGTASGYWSVRTSGLPVIGGGSGYLVARFRPTSAPAQPAAPPPVAAKDPLPPPQPPREAEPVVKPASAAPAEVVSRTVELEVTARLEDADGDKVLDAGEEATLEVSVKNKGDAPARDVRLALSGDPTLVTCFGAGGSLGVIAPGASAIERLPCHMPVGTPSRTAILRLEALAGPKAETASARILKIGMKAAPETDEEVVSETNVDDIPSRPQSVAGTHNVAVVIGLSRYRERTIPAVKYAARDAEVVSRYLSNLAGVAPENMKLLTDDSATRSDFEAYFEDWLPRHVSADSTVFVYYSGHGAPDDAGKGAFLVPYEGQADFPSKLYSLDRLYAALGKLPAKAVVVMLDSCFSGAKGRGLAKEGARPLVAGIEKTPGPGAKVAVLAGAMGSQIASDLDSAEHGLFTYYLLKGLRGEADADGDGTVNLGELYAFARDGVSRKASRLLNRDQTPVLLGDATTLGRLELSRR